MSAKFVEKLFNEQLIKIANTKLRDEIEKQPGQVLVLRDLKEFNKVLVNKLNISGLNSAQSGSAIAEGRKKALRLHNAFMKAMPDRYKVTLEKLEELGFPESEIGEKVFVVRSFSKSLSLVKRAIVAKIVKLKGLDKGQEDQLSRMTHKGHGVRGFAVSQAEIGSGANFIIRQLSELGVSDPQEYLGDLFTSFAQGGEIKTTKKQRDLIKQIITRYNQIIDPRSGRLSSKYVSLVTYQYGSENSGRDATFERKLKDLFFGPFAAHVRKNILTMPGSSSLEQKALATIIRQFKITIKQSKSGSFVLRIENSINPDKVKYQSRGVAKTTTKQKKGKATLVRGATGGIPKLKSQPSKATMPDIRSLIGLLNQRLPGQVAKNMESPALNYRTGRFASSVRVTDITPTTKGLPSIGFTYQKDPYQVFEYPGSGNSLAQNPFPGARDPRALIDRSIRELMAEFVVGRFYTRRQ